MPYKDLERRRQMQRLYQARYYETHKQEHIGRVRRAEAKRRREIKDYIDELKRKPCTDCGLTFDPVCMDFDHLDGSEKSFNVSVSTARRFSREIIDAEIAKCELVCANCHRLRTKARRFALKQAA